MATAEEKELPHMISQVGSGSRTMDLGSRTMDLELWISDLGSHGSLTDCCVWVSVDRQKLRE